LKTVTQLAQTNNSTNLNYDSVYAKIDLVKFLRCTRRKIGHFGDVLPSQPLGVVLKKLNLTEQNKQHKN